MLASVQCPSSMSVRTRFPDSTNRSTTLLLVEPMNVYVERGCELHREGGRESGGGGAYW